MADLIPLLAHAMSSTTPSAGTAIPAEFITAFVALHGSDWARAQSHWERIVERVLDTDAVDAHASGNAAIRQAVRATVILLARRDLAGRCPYCTRRPVGGVPAARGGTDE